MNDSEEMRGVVYRTLVRIFDAEPEWLSTCEALLEELEDSEVKLSEEQEERLINSVHEAVQCLSELPDQCLLRIATKAAVLRLEEGSDDGS